MYKRFTTLFFSSLFISVLLVSVFNISVHNAFAQNVLLESATHTYKPGEQFLVEVSVNTLSKAINTVSGSISIPQNFTVSDIRSGNSVISIWITNPQLDAHNGISFAGGTPGGYNGSNGQLFSFILTSKQEGTFTLTEQNLKILLNDGNGTEAKSQPQTLALTISTKAGSTTTSFVATTDTTPPEQFKPVISKDKNVADNKFFASFFAVDKDSGIARYTISEQPYLFSWLSTSSTTENSPFILTNQVLPEKVIVKAYDRAGNVTEATAAKPAGILFYIYVLVSILIIFGFLYRFTHRRKNI